MKIRICLMMLFLLFSSAGNAFVNFVATDMNEAGVGKWMEMPFGQMRMLSCSTGVKDLSVVVGGLQVRLQPQWRMKRPVLSPLSAEGASWIETPVVPGDGQNAVYERDVLFPVVVRRNPDAVDDFEFGVQGELPVCEHDKCFDLPIRIGISLPATEPEPTSVCAYLMDQQRHVPLPAKMKHIQGMAWQQGEEIHFLFKGTDNAKIAFLQTRGAESFQLLETQMEKTVVLMRVKTKAWTGSKEWILITDRGIFNVPVSMQKAPVPFKEKSTSWQIWLAGWEVFFLTPLFIWWALGVQKNQKAWQKAILQFILLFPAVFVLKVVLHRFMPLDGGMYAIILYSLVCLFPPLKNKGALVVFCLWPCFPTMPQLPWPGLCLWGAVVVLQALLPFVLLYFCAKEIGGLLRSFKQKNFLAFNLIFLLPTLVLLGGEVWTTTHQKFTYADTLNTNGWSVLCSGKSCLPWQQEANTLLIAPDTSLGRALQKRYNRSRMVIWQAQGERFILAPDISVKQAKIFKENWQRYHAVGRPSYPRVRFPDGRHVLSPNAK